MTPNSIADVTEKLEGHEAGRRTHSSWGYMRRLGMCVLQPFPPRYLLWRRAGQNFRPASEGITDCRHYRVARERSNCRDQIFTYGRYMLR